MRKAYLCIVLACLRPAAIAAVFDGRVLEDHNGSPLTRAEIRITLPHSDAIVAELETDSQGRFHTPDLPDAEYLLRFSKTNFATLEVTTTPRSGMQMRMVHFAVIDGKIYESNGSLALNFPKDSVVALSPSGVKSGTTDRNSRPGEYHIYGLPPGRYHVAVTDVSSEGGHLRHGVFFQPNNSQPREFTISGGEEYSGADFMLPAGTAYTVSGKATLPPNPTPQSRTIFTVVSADRPGLSFATAVVRPDGAFSVPDLLPGNYELLATAGRGETLAYGRVRVAVTVGDVEGVSLAADQTRSATLTLRAQEPCNSGVTVDLTSAEAWYSASPVSTIIHIDKPASLAHLAPSRYAITAKAIAGNCYAVAPPFLDVVRESTSKPMEVALVPRGSIRGHLAGGARTAGYVAVLIAPDGSQQIVFPDEKGQFTFADLVPGRYSVIAAAPGSRWMPPEDRMPPPVEVTPGAPTQVELRIAEVAQ